MQNLIQKVLEAGPLSIASLCLDVVIVLVVLVLAVGMRRRIASISRILVILAIIPSLLSMAWPLFYFSEFPTQDEWMARSPAEPDSELLIRPVGQLLGTVDVVRLILSAGFGTTLLCLLIAYGLGSPRGRFEHALGMAIGGVFAVISGPALEILLRIGAPYWERSHLPNPPPLSESESASGSYYPWCVAISAVVLIAGVTFILYSVHRWRFASYKVE